MEFAGWRLTACVVWSWNASLICSKQIVETALRDVRAVICFVYRGALPLRLGSLPAGGANILAFLGQRQVRACDGDSCRLRLADLEYFRDLLQILDAGPGLFLFGGQVNREWFGHDSIRLRCMGLSALAGCQHIRACICSKRKTPPVTEYRRRRDFAAIGPPTARRAALSSAL